MSKAPQVQDKNRLDPDPFTIILGALGAFSSIASIYSVWEQERSKKKAKSRAKLRYYRSLEELSEVCEEIIETLGDLTNLLQSAEIIRGDGASGPIGANALLLNDKQARRYKKIVDRTAKQFSRATHAALDLIDASSDASLNVDSALFGELRELRGRMNAVLRIDADIFGSIKETINIADALRAILERMDRPV
jgi:hypothetical protein